jgi:hypothetical protein
LFPSFSNVPCCYKRRRQSMYSTKVIANNAVHSGRLQS